MREKGKRLIAIILSCLLLLSNVTVYAATETEAQSDTQNTVSVSDSEEAVTLPEEPTNGSAGEEAAIQIQNEPNDEDTSGETEETETSVPINETDPSEILETPKNMVGIELSSFNFLLTTRSVGIPTIGSTATGTCYIGDSWNVNYPYTYFLLSGLNLFPARPRCLKRPPHLSWFHFLLDKRDCQGLSIPFSYFLLSLMLFGSPRFLHSWKYQRGM